MIVLAERTYDKLCQVWYDIAEHDHAVVAIIDAELLVSINSKRLKTNIKKG